MKISTKIILGYVLLILIMVAAVVYELSLVHTMHAINHNLALMNTRATDYSLEARDIDQVEEFTEKLFVTGDPEYSSQLKENLRLFTEDLEKIQASGTAAAEKKELEQLSALWRDFAASASAQETRFAQMSQEEFRGWLSGHMQLLRAHMGRIIAVNQKAIDQEVQRSALAGQKAEFVSRVAAVIAIVLSCLISFVIVHSISLSLEQLTHGARAVAQGQFSYRLDASGNDNFSKVARDFNFMVSRLDEMEQLKRDYVSHVSHELKAPLAAIQETSRFLKDAIPGPINEKQEHLLGLSLECGERLSRTIGSLLDLSRMESDALDYGMGRNDLRDVIRQVVNAYEVQFAEKDRNVELELPSDPLWVDCDADRVGQIVSNLIDNALKFSPNSTPIWISARPLAGVPQNLPVAWGDRVANSCAGYSLVRVADSGRGVPEQHKELIFEKFHQVKFEKKIAGQGVGLGLVICRNIASAHQGAIWVEDNPGGGSVFFILLPNSSKPGPVVDSVRTRDEGPVTRGVQTA